MVEKDVTFSNDYDTQVSNAIDENTNAIKRLLRDIFYGDRTLIISSN